MVLVVLQQHVVAVEPELGDVRQDCGGVNHVRPSGLPIRGTAMSPNKAHSRKVQVPPQGHESRWELSRMWVQGGSATLLIASLVGCAPSYQSATLSTLAPKSRITLSDSTKIAVEHPDVRRDTLYSNQRPIPVDSIAHVEAERGVSENGVLAAIGGAILGLVVAHEAGGL